MIVVQHSAQPLPSLNRSVVAAQIDLGGNQLVPESLMIPFQVVMCHELPDCPAQRTLAKKDQSIQAPLFDRAHKAFRMRVQIGRARRQFHRLDSNFRKHPLKLRGE